MSLELENFKMATMLRKIFLSNENVVVVVEKMELGNNRLVKSGFERFSEFDRAKSITMI